MSFVDVFIIFAFLFHAIASGFRNKNKASENLEEYFLAGRTLPGWKAGISMAATQFAADTPLLVTGLIATAGIFSLWRLWIYAISFLLMGFLLARSWRKVGVLTDAELTEVRYSSKAATTLRMVKAIYFGTIFNCTVMAMVLLAASRIAEPFLVWNEWLPPEIFQHFVGLVEWGGVPITLSTDSPMVWTFSANNLFSLFAIVGITTLYSTTGGLRSVVATDVVQFFIMMFATLIYAGIVIYQAGGVGEMVEKVRALYNGANLGLTGDQIMAFTPDQAYNVSWAIVAVFALQWLIQMNSDGTGYLAQRSMACKSEKDAKIAAIVFTFAQIFFRSLFWIPIGVGLIVLFPPAEMGNASFIASREATFVLGIGKLLPPGVKGLMLTGMLAALASTIDTHLNWGSSYWSNDLYKRLYCEIIRKKDVEPSRLVWVARISNVFILLIAIVIMFNMDSIQTAWQASLILGSSMGVPLILRWVWWRMNSWGEIFAIGSSLVVAPLLLTTFSEYHESVRLLIMASVSLIACLIGVFTFGPETEETLDKFYKRAHPLGFWEPVARRAGHDVKVQKKHFIHGLLATGTCTLSIFCMLVGIGSLVMRATPPSWFPSLWGWGILNILVGLALIPLWLKWGKINKEIELHS